MSGGFDFFFVFLAQVTKFNNVGMPEERIIVEGDFCVENAQMPVFHHNQRIYLT